MGWKPVAPKDDLVARNEELLKAVKKGRLCVKVRARDDARRTDTGIATGVVAVRDSLAPRVICCTVSCRTVCANLPCFQSTSSQ